jgi:DnaJ-class molecular chaperone
VLAKIRIRARRRHAHRRRQHRQDVDVPLETAIFGGKVSLATPDGKKVALTIPAWTSSGQTLRLKGKGLPTAKKSGHGDLLAVLHIQLPMKNARRWKHCSKRPPRSERHRVCRAARKRA